MKRKDMIWVATRRYNAAKKKSLEGQLTSVSRQYYRQVLRRKGGALRSNFDGRAWIRHNRRLCAICAEIARIAYRATVEKWRPIGCGW